MFRWPYPALMAIKSNILNHLRKRLFHLIVLLPKTFGNLLEKLILHRITLLTDIDIGTKYSVQACSQNFIGGVYFKNYKNTKVGTC